MSKLPGDRAWDAADRHRRDADALRARLAAAEAREARLVGAANALLEIVDRDHDAVHALRAALTPNGAALTAAIEGVLKGWFVGCDIANDEMDDLMARLRAAWRGA